MRATCAEALHRERRRRTPTEPSIEAEAGRLIEAAFYNDVHLLRIYYEDAHKAPPGS